jgi:GTPase SAR1 family protein
LTEWLKEIKSHAAEDVRIYLIGNKSELEDQREITFDRAVDFAKSNGIHKCFETSAKTGMNVEEVFSCAGKELFHAILREQQENDKVLQGSSTGKTKGVKGNEKLTLNTQGEVKKKDAGCKC